MSTLRSHRYGRLVCVGSDDIPVGRVEPQDGRWVGFTPTGQRIPGVWRTRSAATAAVIAWHQPGDTELGGDAA